jgi:signal transduction histidine kinase
MRRLKILFAAFALLVLVPAGVLLWYALRFLASEERRLGEEAESERERALRAVEAEVRSARARTEAVESQRPWYHYRNRFVPPDLTANAVAFVRTPLFPAPADPFIRAYFEFDPRTGALRSPAEGGPAPEDADEAALARAQVERIRALAPALRFALARLYERRADFGEPLAEAVTSKLIIEYCADPASVLGELEAAQTGDLLRQRKLESQWEQHRAAQSKARYAYQEAKEEQKKSARDAPREGEVAPRERPASSAGAPGRGARAARETNEPGPQQPVSFGEPAWNPPVLDDANRAKVLADPLAAAVRTWPLRYTWAGEGPARALIAARLADLDGQLVLQGYELDLDRFRALARAGLARLGLAGEVAIRDAASAKDVLALEPTAPPEARATSSLGPSRRLLWGAAALIFFLATAGVFVLYGIVRGHLELARRRTDFLAAISHELKAPLTAIRALAEMLSLGIVPERAKEKEYFAHIRAESERLSRMIANVLDLSRIERRERTYDFLPGDAGEVVQALADAFRPHLSAQGFTFDVEVAKELPSARFDRDAVAQVLANLLDNAVKYTAPCATKRIALRARPGENGEVWIEVEDSGIGISRDDRRRLFSRFARGSSPLARGTGGAGLGLAIAKDHLDAHGGRIEVESEPGKGSTFRVVLPAVS